MFERVLSSEILSDTLHKQKVIVIYGPRQVGKTTLVKQLIKVSDIRFLSINADEQKYTKVFSSRDLSLMESMVSGYTGLFIDEAQRIPNIGINLKILHDAHPELKIIVTGSSSFDLAHDIQEPLTGRTRTYTLFPMAVYELQKHWNPFELQEKWATMLRYGCYPEVLTESNSQEKEKLLQELSQAYLYKDVLEMLHLRKSDKLHDLLRLLAFQIGSQVSISELGKSLELSKETVSHYLELLEKSFVIFRLRGFSRNLRKELTKMDKIYFVDVGIRNAILENFKPLEHRQDVGALWENFVISERRKTLAYTSQRVQSYFWRTYTGSEIDYVEEQADTLTGIEIKWKEKPIKTPELWKTTYPNAQFLGLHSGNVLPFLCP